MILWFSELAVKVDSRCICICSIGKGIFQFMSFLHGKMNGYELLIKNYYVAMVFGKLDEIWKFGFSSIGSIVDSRARRLHCKSAIKY